MLIADQRPATATEAVANLDRDTELLTATEVAALLKIGRSTVYLLCKQGVLPTITIRRSVRIPTSGLRRWLAQHTSLGELEESA